MNRFFLVCIASILLLSATAFGQGTCQRHVETSGRFSYCPPQGWEVRDGSSPYKSFFTARGSTLRANFNVKDEATTLSNDEYMARALIYMLDKNEERGAEARKLIGWTKFTTASKLSGSRMVYETMYQGMLLRTVQFVFDFPGRKVLVTGTSLVSDKATTDPIFDGVARSLKAN